MRPLIFALTAFAACGPALAQQWQSSIHGECSPYYLAADSSGQRIVVSMADGAGIWLTDDAGQNWTQINDRVTGQPVNFPIVYCEYVTVGAAADTMILNMIYGQGGDLNTSDFHTFDGGETWASYREAVADAWPDSISSIGGNGNPTLILDDRIYFSNQEGFAISYDDGESWDVIDVGPYHCGLNGVTFNQSDPDMIFLYGIWGDDYDGGPQVGGVIGSYDGGLTWRRLTDMEDLTDDPFGAVVQVRHGEGDNLYALTAWSPGDPHPPLLHSPDMGSSWEWIEAEGLPELMLTRYLAVVPERPGRMLVAGPFNTGVWESEDGGENWHRLLRGLPESPSAVRCIYRNPFSGHLYICFVRQGIWGSLDSGDTWQQVPSPPIGMMADSYYDIGLIAGEGGVLHGFRKPPVFYAPDDATEFAPVPLFTTDQDHELFTHAVAYPEDMPITANWRRDIWTLEEEQDIVRSTDDGETWTRTPCGFPGLAMTTAVNTDSGLVIVGTGNAHDIYRSSDFGENWQHHELDFTFTWSLMTVGSSLYAARVTDPADLVWSDDLGETWRSLDFPAADQLVSAYMSPILSDNDTLFVRARHHCWARLPDGAWQQRAMVYPYISNVSFFDWDVVSTIADTFIVAGTDFYHDMATSYDGGWTWEYQEVELPGGYQGERSIELEYDRWRDRLWVDTGLGLAYLDDPTSAVGEEVWRFQPATFVTLDAYPNPFNTTATVRYSLAKPGEVTLDVYDLLGRRVASLVRGLRAPGAHTVTFDASALASGPYFLRLTAGAQSATRKITLTK
ncbi:MAG: hypothetical protein MAG453_00816 [Calditrichaeota bacterium]|nr:hypothetical protein [Calditrichota bacterium]